MQNSNADRKEQNDKEREKQEIRRGHRTTPRQVWKSRQENRPQKNTEDPPTEPVIKDKDEDTSHQKVERTQQKQQPASKTTADGSDMENKEDKKEEPVMVDSQKQPGFMKYPYSTHRDAPGDDEKSAGNTTANTESRFSRNFVLGTLIILAALLIGLLVASQGRRIDELDRRIKQLESTMQIDE